MTISWKKTNQAAGSEAIYSALKALNLPRTWITGGIHQVGNYFLFYTRMQEEFGRELIRADL